MLHKRFKDDIFVENDMIRALYVMEFILEEIISLVSGITIEKAQVHSNALKSSDVSWYRDTFDMMHRYSCTVYRPISTQYVHTYLLS